jgi:hypothetical protein
VEFTIVLTNRSIVVLYDASYVLDAGVLSQLSGGTERPEMRKLEGR